MDDEYNILKSNLEEEYYEESKQKNGIPSNGKLEKKEKSRTIHFSKKMLSDLQSEK